MLRSITYGLLFLNLVFAFSGNVFSMIISALVMWGLYATAGQEKVQ